MESVDLHTVGAGIFGLFKELASSSNVTGLQGWQLTNEEQRFRLWAHSLGLHHVGHASLDYRVRDAVVVKNRLAEILEELREHLASLLEIIRGERMPFELDEGAADEDDEGEEEDEGKENEEGEEGDDDEEDDDDNTNERRESSDATRNSSEAANSEGSIHEVDFRLQSVEERVDALYSLATKIRNPRNRPQRTTHELYKHVPRDLRADYMREREDAEIAIVAYAQTQQLLEGLKHGDLEESSLTPEQIVGQYASATHWLIRRTGMANARRRQQFVYWEQHASRISSGPTLDPSSETTKEVNSKDVAMDTIVEGKMPGREPTKQQQTLAPDKSLATSATKLDKNFVKLDDLGSLISHQSRVSTVMNLRGDKLLWPSPPTLTVNSWFFTCPYCKIICPHRYLAKDAWMMHLIHDLQPYHCTYEECRDPNRIYGTRQEWLDHESTHTRVWHCQVHATEFETQPEYMAHIGRDHPDMNPAQSSAELVAAVVGPSLKVHRDCPFCPTSLPTTQELQKHIAFHLERLALFTIPADDGGDTDGYGGGSSNSHQGQRRGRQGSVEEDFTIEEQLKFQNMTSEPLTRDTELGIKRQTDPPTMEDARRLCEAQEPDSGALPRWLAGVADAAPDIPLFDELSGTREAPDNGDDNSNRYDRRHEGNSRNPTFAPVEEHFPLLPYRDAGENFRSVPESVPVILGTIDETAAFIARRRPEGEAKEVIQ